MYIAGQRIRAGRLTPAAFPSLLLLFLRLPKRSVVLSRSSFRQSGFPFDCKACLRSLRRSAFPPGHLTLPYLPTYLTSIHLTSIYHYPLDRRSIDPVPLFRLSLWQIRPGSRPWRTPYIVTFAAHWPSFSKYHRFPIIGAGWEQLWRVLITYSISWQPV